MGEEDAARVAHRTRAVAEISAIVLAIAEATARLVMTDDDYWRQERDQLAAELQAELTEALRTCGKSC